jgi:hypothetical protein
MFAKGRSLIGSAFIVHNQEGIDMSEKLDRKLVSGRGAVVASLIGVVACALAGDALASLPPTQSSAREGDLSTRVAAIVVRIRLGDPALVPALPPERKIAQWRNY